MFIYLVHTTNMGKRHILLGTGNSKPSTSAIPKRIVTEKSSPKVQVCVIDMY